MDWHDRSGRTAVRRDRTRNAVSPDHNGPTTWRVQSCDKAGNVIQAGQNIRWQAPLGSLTFGDPVVASGLVWVGTNNYQMGDAKAEERFKAISEFPIRARTSR